MHVTGVASTRNLERVRSLGAHEVIDYTQRDFLQSDARYDVLMDMVGNRALTDCKRVLNEGGRYVPCSLGSGDWVGPIARIIGGLLVFSLGGKRFRLFVQGLDARDLAVMREFIEAGTMRPVVERVWSLPETAAALRHVGAGHSRGLNVVRVSD